VIRVFQAWTLCLALTVFAAGCSRSPEAKAARAMQRGKEAMDRQDYSRAAIQFKIAAQALPREAEPLYQLALVYLQIGDVPTAVEALLKAGRVDPKHTASQLKLTQLMALNTDPTVVREAEQRARAVLAASQENVDAIATLALAEMRLGETESAEEHLKTALARFPQDLKSSLLLAELKIASKDLPAAEAILREAAAQKPNSPDPLVALARFYMLTGRFADAEDQITHALRFDPKNGPALEDLAAIQIRQGRNDQAGQTFKILSELPDERYRTAHAVYLFQYGSKEAAITELVKLSKAKPEDRKIRTELVAAYLSEKRNTEAAQVLTAALKKNPRDTDALLQRSQIYVLSSKLQEAQNDLNQVLGYRPDSATAHYLLARVYLAEGWELNRRHELVKALDLDPGLLGARMDLAQSLISDQDPRAALELMRSAPANQTNSIPVMVQMNWALYAQGNLAEMRKGVDRGLALNRAPDLVFQDALLKLRSGDLAAGRAALQEVLKDHPDNVSVLDVLTQTYLSENKRPEALGIARKYASDHPKSAALQEFLGMALMNSGDLAGARTALEAAKAADAGSASADFALARLDLTEGKLDTAWRRLSGTLASNPNDLNARILMGMVDEVGGQPLAATEQYRKVLEAEPEDVYALNNLAYLLGADGKPAQLDEALKLAQKAAEVNSSSPEIQDTLGWIYFQKGLYKNALQHLVPAAKKGRAPVQMYHLAMTFYKSGDKKQAEEVYEAALRLNPNLRESELARQVMAAK
jgi:tetratricopeptide (TPR) repeat protein